ncbi:5100_t:CDS:2 [Ambispora gerdemannii]|uniref:5100_t:CDS:1 n=1 Tax=Ambispora gerdemannii TaxID=144530 RepID=A0A9N9BSM3_9GLOM|nr:5100_t:CDS:2 [Ambispora gerdemannii]
MQRSPRVKFKPQAPKGLSRLHRLSDLGYPDYYPPRENQDEDQMTEDNVRKGFTYTSLISDESATRHDTIYANLKGGLALKNMGDSMLDLLKRKRYEDEEDIEPFNAVIPLPKRVWMDDRKTEVWCDKIDAPELADLIKDGMPLHLRGEELLMVLCQRRPNFMRALELIKLVGQLEEPNYKKNWAVTCSEFLKQKVHILQPKEWRYSVQLSRFQYDEGLTDQRILKLILDHIRTFTDHNYIALWLSLVIEFLSIYTGSRTLMRLLIDYLLKKLKEFQLPPSPTPPTPTTSSSTVQSPDGNRNSHAAPTTANAILWASFVTLPDMFVNPKHWYTYKDVIQNIIFESHFNDENDRSKSAGHRTIEEEETLRIWEKVRRRNEFFSDSKEELILLEKNLSKEPRNRLFIILDKVNRGTNYDELAAEYFPGKSIYFPIAKNDISSRIQALCYWAATNTKVSDHRPYVACTILSKWKKRNDISNDEDEKCERQDLLQDSLLTFLDEYDCGSAIQGYEFVAHLFSELIRCNHFSPNKYIQRLISRGDLTNRNDERTLRHLKYVECFPLYSSSVYLYNQRKWVLYGIGCQNKDEEMTFKNLREKIMAKLPRMFGEGADNLDAPVDDNPIDDFELSLPLDQETCAIIKNTTRFNQMLLTQNWLVPRVKEFIQKAPITDQNWRNKSQPGATLLNARQFATIVQVLEHARDFNSLIDLSLWVLEKTLESSLFPVIIDTFARHEIVWAAMDRAKEVFNALHSKHKYLRGKKSIERNIVEYMCQLCGLIPKREPAGNKDQQVKEFFNKLLTDVQKGQLIEELKDRLKLSLQFTKYWDKIGIDSSQPRVLDIARKCKISHNTWVRNDRANDCPYSILNFAIEIIREHAEDYYEFRVIRNVITIFGDILRDICDRTKDGCLDTVFKFCIEQHVSVEDGIFKQPNAIWFLFFLETLVVRRLLSIDTLIAEIIDNFERLANKSLTDEVLNATEIDETKNLTLLMSIIFAQEGGDLNEDLGLCTINIQMLQTHCVSLSSHILTSLSTIILNLTTIESRLPLNNPLVEQIQKFCKDLANTFWFRRICANYPKIAYQLFVVQARESSVKSAEMKMIEIMQMAFGEGDPIHHHLATHSSFAYLEYFKYILSQINFWNIHVIAIQFRLCMDSLMLSKNTSTLSPEEKTTTTDAQGDIVMSDASRPESQHSDANESSIETAIIKYFWEEVVLQQQFDACIIKELVDGVRKDFAHIMLDYGMLVLKRREPLIPGIEHIFRALLRTINDEEKSIVLSEELLSQVSSLCDEISEGNFQSAVISRIHILIPLTDAILSRVSGVQPEKRSTHEMFEKIRECRLIEQWVFTLINLLISDRLHELDSDPANFDILLDLVSFLLDEMGTKARVILAGELKKATFVLPSMWEERIRRILPLRTTKQHIGADGKPVNAWKVTEYIGKNKVLAANDAHNLWPGAKIYLRPKSRKDQMTITN